MNLRKLKFWSGMAAFILFGTGMVMAAVLREILIPEDRGILTFDTYGGLGGIILYLMISAAALATFWVVLALNDTDQPDILDARTRLVIVSLYGGLSLATGLLFYTNAYYPLVIIVPLALGFFVNWRFGKSYPPSLLKAYANICNFIGLLGGYIIATYLIWNDMWLVNGEEPVGSVSSAQFVSVLRIIFTIFLYVLINFIVGVIAFSQRSVPANLSSGERREIVRCERKRILKVTLVVLPIILLINIVPWNGDFGLWLSGAAICYGLMFMTPSILKLVGLYTKNVWPLDQET